MNSASPRRPRRLRLVLGLVAVLASALLLAACGSSSSSSSSTTASTSTGTSTTGGRAGGFRQSARTIACLRAQGVTLPQRRPGQGRPTGTGTNGAPPAGAGRGFFGGGRGQSSAQRTRMQAAFRRCGVTFGGRGGRGGFGGRRFNSATYRAAITRFVACVRQHGYDLPAPNTTGRGPVFDSSKVNQRDPKFIAASRACASDLPQFGRGGGQGGAPPAGGGAGGTTTTS